MKFRPVRKSRPPGYPTRVEVLADPRLLRANMPAAWRLNAGLASAAAVLVALAAPGCSDGSRPGAIRSAPAEEGVAGPASTSLMTDPRHRRLVAPFFEHGPGRGSTGCIVLNPPSFLSEEEALAVIREELTQVGISLSDENVVVYHGPPRDPAGAWYRRRRWSTGDSPWIMDAVDPDRRVAVEFISRRDESYLGRGVASTVQGFDCLSVAKWVHRNLVREDVDPYLYAVFYDPLGHVGAADLRAQVRDFVDWLKLNSLD